jgi:hypothetical protein
MAWKLLIVVVLFLEFVNIGESAVITQSKKKELSSTDWKDKLSQVLDTESQELQILHNLIEQDDDESSVRAERKDGEVDTTSKTIISGSVSDSVASLREQGIVSKLQENSKTMDKMAVFLNDLKNVLSEAIKAQDKQMRFENEVVELREELDFLR